MGDGVSCAGLRGKRIEGLLVEMDAVEDGSILGAELEKAARATYGLLDECTEGSNEVSRNDIVHAHGGDFKLFDRSDADANGEVTEAEWMKALEEEFRKKGAKKKDKGEKWLKTLLHTLNEHLVASRATEPAPAPAAAAAATVEAPTLQKEVCACG